MSLFRALYAVIRNNKQNILYSLIIIIVLANLNSILIIKRFNDESTEFKRCQSESKENDSSKFSDNPIIFVGGSPRSGTTFLCLFLMHVKLYCLIN